MRELARLAAEIRGRLVEMSCKARTAHLGSALSCVDILVSAYWGRVFSLNPSDPDDPKRDRVILGKGHGVSALYAALAYRGYFPVSLLDTYNDKDGDLPEHPGPACVAGLEFAAGSLGHGLPVGLGMTLAGQIKKQPFKVLVVMSDGECNEGSVWEAAMMAPMHAAGDLTVVIDYNGWQATGRSNEVMSLSPLRQKWEAFGWHTCEVDGHDIQALINALSTACAERQRPSAIVAHTIKGKGVSFMEDDNNWHYRVPSSEEVVRARRELGLQ